MGRLRRILNRYGDDTMLVVGLSMLAAGILWRHHNYVLVIGGLAVVLVELFLVKGPEEKQNA